MQYWPRKRAKRITARIRSKPTAKDAKILGFAGYKAGMTHVNYVDQGKNSLTNGIEVSTPVTIVECPPVKIMSVRFYKKDYNGMKIVTEVFAPSNDKDLKRKVRVPKKAEPKFENLPEYDELRVLAHTQPRLAGFGKKKPDVLELFIGGNKDEQLNYAKENLGKEIKISDVFSEGQMVDIHGVTTGKGFQGTVKRFGVSVQRPKKEKVKRGPGSIAGGWKAQGHMMYRVAFPGGMGYHQRTEFNKQVIKISDAPKEVNPKGGLLKYGVVKSTFVLLKGSVMGPKKRIIRMSPASRAPKEVAPIEAKYISVESQQR